MNIYKTSLYLLAAGVMLAACSTDDNSGGGTNPIPENSFYNFATYNGSSDKGSSFSVQPEGDGSSATITFSNTFTDKQLTVGNRVFMAYTTMSGQQYTSGPGTLYSISNANGGKPVAADASNRVKVSTPIKLTEMKRTGRYLNVVFQVPARNALNTLQLTEKPNEKEPAYPMLGLFVRTDSEQDNYKYVRVSFDVESVLEPADVKGFKVEYFGDGGVDTLTFAKGSGTGTIVPRP
ncbi:MAG: hypothetical protein K2L27_00735 [Muribaculaceae bacterium]|nr:hypothetical protein [Muribaculaceae bacterium]